MASNSMVETHRSLANSWECDENQHINVQFYMQRFGEASQVLPFIFGVNNSETQSVYTNHIRFHRELVEGDAIAIKSGAIVPDHNSLPDLNEIVHFLSNAYTGQLCATCIDHVKFDISKLPQISRDEIAQSNPRGIERGAQPGIDISHRLENNSAFISSLSVVQPSQCDVDGNLLPQFYIARFSDGASHLWEHIGLRNAWLKAQNFGRVAVELKLTRLSPIRAGSILKLISWAQNFGTTTFMIAHQLVDISEENIVATGRTIALMMDLSARKAVPLPHSILEIQN